MSRPTPLSTPLEHALQGRSPELQEAMRRILAANDASEFAAAERAIHRILHEEADTFVALAL